MDLYTIGHSNLPLDRFIQLLQTYSIQLLVDVRSTPYSRFNPQFNQTALQNSLSEQTIEYFYLGNDLGGRPKDPDVYHHHAIPKAGKDYFKEIDYAAVMQRPWFTQGIQQLLELANRKRTAILCSEEDPARCHRHHLIARYILDTLPEVNVMHIRKDGSLQEARSLISPADAPGADQLSFLKP
ncbi:MAG TPA: DUF488 domain-containing protein [Anaerolineales bacterium]